jgi:hypothetical protein
VNREQRRAQRARLLQTMRESPYWQEYIRRYPLVDLHAPELPGRRYRTCVHHAHTCSAHRGGDTVDETVCDCASVTTKHIEPMLQ